MSEKISGMRAAAEIEAQSKIKTAAELAELVERLSIALTSLTEETRDSMRDGKEAAQAIQEAAEILTKYKPAQPEPVIHEAPIWPMLAAAGVIGLTLGASLSGLIMWKVLPPLHKIDTAIQQAAKNDQLIYDQLQSLKTTPRK